MIVARSVLLSLFVALSAAACGSSSNTAPPPAQAGEIRVTADSKGFSPNAITLKKGGPGTITFVRTAENTCATEVEFKELSMKKELPLNQPVAIQIPTGEAKTYNFACGMGMYKSSVTVQ